MIFRLEPPPDPSRPALDPLAVVRAHGLLPLFETAGREACDPTFRPYLAHLPGETDFESVRPRLKKAKIFGTRLELLEERPAYRPLEPLDPELLKRAFTFAALPAARESAKKRPLLLADETKKKKKRAKTASPSSAAAKAKAISKKKSNASAKKKGAAPAAKRKKTK